MTPTHREKFQTLLRKLFQFDCAELDFGIYRIMNHKRQAVEDFIQNDLLAAVAGELQKGALAQESGLAEALEETKKSIIANVDEDAFDAEGILDPQWHKSKLGKEYLDLQQRASFARGKPEVEAEIFNHLYTFFSRYYDSGDFMSLRRYSRREKYAIPYNGEEVHLHWANNDQYYIKTGENFTDYAYKHGAWTVRFALRNAEVEQNNVKGAKRFFLPQTDQLAIDEKEKSITLPMHYRPLNEAEQALYAKKKKGDDESEDDEENTAEPGGKTKAKGKTGIEGIISDAVAAIEKLTAKSPEGARSALSAEKRRAADGRPVPLIEHHLRFYTAKNSSDFFIHKDLGGFLARELDFYIKNDVLNVDEISEAGPARAEAWFQIMRCLKGVGIRIITFLAQIENFQKRLFEKKKFVTEVNWCVTLDRVPESLYPEILKNKEQLQEWRELFHIQEIEGDLASPGYSEPLKTEFLKSQPFLVLDTRFFSQDFKDVLLESKEFLGKAETVDESAEGLMIESDNFQALGLLHARFQRSVSCCYIDPPYNTGQDGFPYKDSYQHSSWLSMMNDRLKVFHGFAAQNGVLYVSIGEEEVTNLHGLLDHSFGESNRLGTLVWKARVKPVNIGEAKYLPQNETEYVLAYETQKGGAKFRPITSGGIRAYPHQLGERKYRTTTILKSNRGTNFRSTMSFELEGYTPPDGQRWQAGDVEIRWLWDNDYIEFRDGVPSRRYFEDEEGAEHTPFYCFMDSEWSGTSEAGKNELNHILGNMHGFDTVKPKRLIMTLLMASASDGDWVLDFFGGSGTTGHSVLQLERDTEAKRRYILVEGAEYFDNLMKRRMRRAIYSKDWKDGKPLSREGISHAFKYLRLESYEDALDNISFTDPQAPQSMLSFDDYTLGYMLDFETKDSATFLNIAALDAPFDYQLKLHGQDKPQPVDLPETFNYLLGLHVGSRRVLHRGKVRYLVFNGLVEGRSTAIFWRTTRGWKKAEWEAEREWVEAEKLTAAAEDVWVNTDSFIPGARSLDPIFKKRMFNED